MRDAFIIQPGGGLQAQGNFAGQLLAQGRIDVGAMKPVLEADGNTYITVCMGDPKLESSYRVQQIPRMSVNATTLRRDEWKLLDDAVVQVARTRLGGIEHFLSKGLTFNIGNAMGTTVLEYHDISDAMEAVVSMDGVTRSKGDAVVYDVKYLPLPITHVDYEINHRTLMASRNLGSGLDVANAQAAARKVLDSLESQLFVAPTTAYTYGTGTIRSLLDEPNRNQVSFLTNGAWDNSAKTGANIIADVLAMKQALIDANHSGGPYSLFIPTAYETTLDDDYDTTTPGTTIRERILKIANITDIVIVDAMTADNVLMVHMVPETCRIVNGMGLTNIEWATEGGMKSNYKVMAIQVPQVRADQPGNSGVCHMT